MVRRRVLEIRAPLTSKGGLVAGWDYLEPDAEAVQMDAEGLEPVSTVVQPEPSGLPVSHAVMEPVSTGRKDKERCFEP